MDSVSTAATACYNGGVSFVQGTLKTITQIRDDTTAFTHLCKIAREGCFLASSTRGMLLYTPLGVAISLVDSVQTAVDINDALNGKLAGASWVGLSQRVAFAYSNAASLACLVIEIGAVPAGAAVTGAMGLIAAGGAAVGFAIGAGKSAWTLASTLGDHKFQNVEHIRIKSFLDMMACVSGCAVCVIATLGITLAAYELAILVIVAAGFGLANFAFERNYEKELSGLEEKAVDANGKEIPTVWIPVISNLSSIAQQSEGLERFCKLFVTVTEGVQDPVVSAFRFVTKTYKDCFDVGNFPKRMHEWINPDATGKRFWEKSDCSPWKILSKVFLTSLGICQQAAFVLKYVLKEFAEVVAKITFCGVPVLLLATMVSLGGSSLFSLVDNSYSINKYCEDNTKAKTNFEKWTVRVADLKVDATKAQTEAELVNSRDRKRLKLKGRTAPIKAKTEAERTALEKKSLADDIAIRQALKAMTAEQFAVHTLHQKEVRYNNATVKQNKTIITMSHDVSKIFNSVFVISSVAAVAALAAAEVIAALAIGATVFGTASAVIGMGKWCYDDQFGAAEKEKTYTEALTGV
jgi:hypothetical protein